MPSAETIALAIESTKPLFLRFLTGFEDKNRTSQSANLPNHAAWSLGHCALTMHRVAERFVKDGKSLPDSDFVTGDGRAGDGRRFDTESVSFGSSPVDDPALYPTLARGMEVFEGACDRLAAAVRAAGDAPMEEMIPWHDGEMPLWKLLFRICFHNGMHAGQITDLRRALALPPVITPSR